MYENFVLNSFYNNLLIQTRWTLIESIKILTEIFTISLKGVIQIV